jgi:hypothetical protein
MIDITITSTHADDRRDAARFLATAVAVEGPWEEKRLAIKLGTKTMLLSDNPWRPDGYLVSRVVRFFKYIGVEVTYVTVKCVIVQEIGE